MIDDLIKKSLEREQRIDIFIIFAAQIEY